MTASESPSQHPDERVQRVQAKHRRDLVATWDLPAGAKVLEIGCGQGDTTIALLEAVGPKGFVTALDSAPPEYGAPLTIGEATQRISQRAPGRVEFRLGFDLLVHEDAFEGAFDVAIVSHAFWYFDSHERLLDTLRLAKKWARGLCIAEWDLEPRSIEQVPHLLAVLIQGQLEAFKAESQANVRSPISKRQARELIERAGWKVVGESKVSTQGMQDADWEIATCMSSSLREASELGLPDRLLRVLEAQIDTLRSIARPRGNEALDCYSMVAE